MSGVSEALRRGIRVVASLALALVLGLTTTACGYLAELPYNPWQLVGLSTDATLLDLAFTGTNPNHGWLVGTSATLLETQDAGKTWEPRTPELENGEGYRFTSVSFTGNEGWIAGKPSVLLHTEDGGQSWSQIPLSSKLPGAPTMVTALGRGSAEMVTDVGAIYRTQDSGRTWKALVGEAVGVIRNLSRSLDGQYVAVSARGNFYSTWKPGQTTWEYHNRNNSRRIQNMGFSPDGNLWMLSRGGQLQFSDPENPGNWDNAKYPEFSVSVGLLDLSYQGQQEIWLAGGSANLLHSSDGGKTWQKDRAVEDVPSNFYRVLFPSKDTGFVLGQQGTLLRYEPTLAKA
ncbi:photosynthesis system II assembly factor Ycf48 [Leptolyngbya sp. FACHB-261]|uniref:photosynthesis system II assembly factor Ycf48 n=1 Tax=Leptolyngbya sp. FACHB-261 TaxID=2692806 RepID=UPI001689AB23|nr:photosynthesis system II assembly factor Ycf48 [Leptolyngbya sp. FACHB-261]MBD2102902.1 photosynthesis system II assembly factor Ycf48 [Leptolyngbya sp. FACHB-261]